MADDSTVGLDFVAQGIDALRRQIDDLVNGAQAGLRELGADHPLVIQTEDAQRRLDALSKSVGKIQGEAKDPAELTLRTAQAQAAVQGLSGEVSELGDRARQIEGPFRAELAKIDADFSRAETTVKSFGEAAATGGKGAQRAFAVATVDAGKLRDQISSLKAAGADVGALEARFQRLEGGIAKGRDAMGQFRKATKDVEDELRLATVRAGEVEGQVNSLTDALVLKFPKAEQAILGAFAALATFKESFRATRDLIEGAQKNLGVDIDKPIREAFGGLFLLYDKLAGAEGDLAEREQRRANLLKVLKANGIEYTDTVEGLARAEDELNTKLRDQGTALRETDAALQGIIEKAAGTGLGALNTRLDAAINSVLAFKGNLGALVSSPVFPSFQREIAELNRIIDEFGASFRATLSPNDQADFDARVEDFRSTVRDGLGKAFREAGAEIDQFVLKIRAAGKVNREEADKLVADIDSQIKALRSLPPQEVKIYAERIKTLLAYRKEFFGFTTEYAELLKKQAEAAEKARQAEAAALKARLADYREFVDGVKSLSEGLPSVLKGPKAPDASDIRGQLAAARKELEGLQSGGATSTEDLNRIDELRAKISDLEIDLSRLGIAWEDAAAGAGQLGGQSGAVDRIRDSVVDLITKSEKFAELFARLPIEFQAALQGLTSGFLSDLSGGLVTSQEDVQAFIDRFTQLLQQGGALTTGFVASLQALGATQKTVFDGIATGAQGSVDALSGIGPAAAAAASAVTPALDAVRASATAAAEAQSKSAAAGDANAESYIKISAAADTSKGLLDSNTTSQGKLTEAVVEHVGAVKDATDNTIRWSESVEGVDHGLVKITKSSEEAAGGVLKIGDQVIRIGEESKKTAPAVDDAASKIDKLGPAGDAAATGLKGLATQAEAAAKPLDAIATSVDGLAKTAPAVQQLSVEVGKLVKEEQPLPDLTSKAAAAIKAEGEAAALAFPKIHELVVDLGTMNRHLAASPPLWKAVRKEVDLLVVSMGKLAEANQKVRDTDPTKD